MIVPRHWAEASARHRDSFRQVTVRRFGWSNESPERAQQIADERAAAALQRILDGDLLDRREPKVAYNGAEGVPIREEILAEHGDVVLTRNSYGAVCLNTPDVLFADVDFGRIQVGRRATIVLQVLALLALLVTETVVDVAGRWPLLFVLVFGLARPLLWLVLWLRQRSRGAEPAAHRRIAAFVRRHPGWQLRVYRTPAGLRLLAMHAMFAPGSEEVRALFDAVWVDPTYAKMCARQHCFRARLSPKPWRIGMPTHLKPRPGVWPVNPERLPERQRWLAEYAQHAVGFAACRYLETVGSGRVDPKCEAVRALHDGLSRAVSELPLA